MIFRKIYIDTFFKYLFLVLLSIMPNMLEGQHPNRQPDNSSNIGFDCTSNLNIIKFKNESTQLSNKVVVGNPISYKATPKNIAPYFWYLGDQDLPQHDSIFVWPLTDIPTAQAPFNNPTIVDSEKGIFYIPETTLPLKNSDLGHTHGHLVLTADSQRDSATIQVFFDKDATNNPHASSSNIPNWFYYWKQEVNTLLQSSGIKFFTLNSDGEPVLDNNPTSTVMSLIYRDDGDYSWAGNRVTYGTTSAGSSWFSNAEFKTVPNAGEICPPLNFRKVMSGYGFLDFGINIGQGCGYEVTIDTYDSTTGTENGSESFEGIEVFLSTIYHEMEHFNLRVNLWPNGYDTADDCDKDAFPDSWEMGEIGTLYGFIVGTRDEYNLNYDPNNLPSAGPSAWYQEVICRNKQTSSNTNLHDDKDWSFDPTNSHQSKNWNE